MAKIINLKISNYRGIQSFEQNFGNQKFICLIGRGDSGKSTILKAISLVLSPNWNSTFLDNDFYNGNILNPIEIEVSLIDFPETFLQEDKFGLFIRGVDMETGIIHDEIQDNHKKVLTIKLTVDKDLEPDWRIVNSRSTESIEIKSRDRGKLNTFLIADYIDKHFSWSQGSPLNSIYKSIDDEEVSEKNIMINALRVAKSNIDINPFSHHVNVINKIKKISKELGNLITEAHSTLDFKELFIRDNKAYLHDGKIPFNLKGKGARRLMSIAIQLELIESGGIVLIDEIEQGLEPDRAQHLTSILKTKDSGQIFIATHSRDVLVELDSSDIFLKRKETDSLTIFPKSLQGILRSNPEAFFSKKILLCEGATEIGICRAINKFRIGLGEKSVAAQGVKFADGRGHNQIEYAKGFRNSGYDVCLFCDSDDQPVVDSKSELLGLGIVIVDTDLENSIEQQLFNDLPWKAIQKLIGYFISDGNPEESVKDSLKSKHDGAFPENWKDSDNVELRKTLGIVSSKKGWFKRIDHGEVIGSIICSSLSEIEGTRLYTQINNLSKWIDDEL